MNKPETPNARVRPLFSAAPLPDVLSRMRSSDDPIAEDAWGEVYLRYHEAVWARVHYVLRTIPWLRDTLEVAGDVTGQVFLSLPAAIIPEREEGRAEQWLLRVALRTALRHREALTGNWSQDGRDVRENAVAEAGRTYLDFDDAPAAITAVFEIAGSVERSDIERVLESWRADSDRSEWLPFIQLFVEGKSLGDICAISGVTAGGARRRLWQIRQELAAISSAGAGTQTKRVLHIDEAMLQDFADGILTTDRDGEVEAHVSICASCQDAVVDARVGLALLVMMRSAPSDLFDVIQARLRAGERPLAGGSAHADPQDIVANEMREQAASDDEVAQAPARSSEIISRLLSSQRPTLNELAAIWRGHDAETWRQTPQVYSLLGRAFLGTGDAVLAHEVLTEARAHLPRDPYVEHLYGLTLARSGSAKLAARHARALKHEVTNDPLLLADVMGLLARTEKDLSMRSSGKRREQHLRRAQAIYRSAFRQTGQSYPAINAATLSLLRGDENQARLLAKQAMIAARQEIDARANPGYWELATLGEAALITGDAEDAMRHYQDAVAYASGHITDIASMRKQARLILKHRNIDEAALEEIFAVPRVTVLAGGPAHTAEQEAAMRGALATHIRRNRVGFGFSSAAAGGDIMFLETLQEAGGQTTIVLPYAQAPFVENEVNIDANGTWLSRFQRVCAASVEVVESSPASGTSGTMREYGHQLLIGMGGMQAQLLDVDLDVVIVVSGEPSGMLRDLGSEWQGMGHEVTVLSV